MKKLIIVVIIILILFFIGGYAFVSIGWLKQDLYTQLATIIGGSASILGLLSFVLPRFKQSDFKSMELSTLKNLAQTAEEIQKKEAELNIKQSDITKLELQRQELEFLVKKASLSLFFKEQIERYYEKLDEQIRENKEISRTIKEIKELEYKMGELDIEIQRSPNTENILEIIAAARKQRRATIEIKTPFDSLFEALKVTIR